MQIREQSAAARDELEIIAQERESLQSGLAWVRWRQAQDPTPELGRALAEIGEQMSVLTADLIALVAAKRQRS